MDRQVPFMQSQDSSTTEVLRNYQMITCKCCKKSNSNLRQVGQVHEQSTKVNNL